MALSDDFNAVITKLNQDVAQVQTLKDQLAAASAQVATLQTNLTNLQAQVTALQGQITDLQNQVAASLSAADAATILSNLNAVEATLHALVN